MKAGNITEGIGSTTIAGRIGTATATGITTENNTGTMSGIVIKGRIETGIETVRRIRTGIETGTIAGMARTDGITVNSRTDAPIYAGKPIEQRMGRLESTLHPENQRGPVPIIFQKTKRGASLFVDIDNL
jgi:hypothetical protein